MLTYRNRGFSATTSLNLLRYQTNPNPNPNPNHLILKKTTFVLTIRYCFFVTCSKMVAEATIGANLL